MTKIRMQLFGSALDPNIQIGSIRASTLARYFWCSPQAWIMGSGVTTPKNDSLTFGTKTHLDIEKSRKFSFAEAQFEKAIKQYYTDSISRIWFNKDGKTFGEIVTHGMDGFLVVQDRKVRLMEYKTKKGWQVLPVDVVPNTFQTNIYMWIHEPYLQLEDYIWDGGSLIYLKRNKDKTFTPIGEKETWSFDSLQIETDYEKIFDEWNRASQAKTNEERRSILIPPKNYKCIICNSITKCVHDVCPFQNS